MWWHHTLGNVKDRPFSQIWPDTSDALMAGLKRHPRAVEGAAPPAPIWRSATATRAFAPSN
jgi:hypothetical protein